jgi:RNA polymerase sigma-54 factor
MKLRQSQSTKLKLSSTLRSWLPILKTDVESLHEVVSEYAKENPYIEVKSSLEKEGYTNKHRFGGSYLSNANAEAIEAYSIQSKTLYDTLFEQINPPLFPTKKSQDIAYGICEFINEEGYFEDGKILAKKLDVSLEEIEKIRKRFAYLEPSGVGAVDFKESFLFQLESLDIQSDVYDMAIKLIGDFDHLDSYAKMPNFQIALKHIKKFKNPPAIDFMVESKMATPDIYVYESDFGLEIALNDTHYPSIEIFDGYEQELEYDYVKQMLKDAKDLVDALDMRKATLYKIGLEIVEYQYDFFKGGDIKPMKLKDIADDLQRAPSTISRAIADKYLSCTRGVIPLKNFFAAAVDEDISNATIKTALTKIIKDENRDKPLSDLKILQMIEAQYDIKMVRRTITKYRKLLNIGSSSERKKNYKLSC